MLKEAGGALLLSPLGLPILVHHGLAGIIIGGAGLIVAKAVMNQVAEKVAGQGDEKGEDSAPVDEVPEESLIPSV